MPTKAQLPQRSGERPATRPVTPHQQLDQTAPQPLQEELWQRMRALDGVLIGRSNVSLPDTRALHLNAAMAGGPEISYLMGTEFAHLHGADDGSLHVVLPEEDAAEAIAKGWAEFHPLVRSGVMPRTVVMVYGPRDQEELEVAWRLVQLSYAFARGTD